MRSSRGHGYELRLVVDRVDAARFERLIAAAEHGDGAPNGEARAALSLWRGSPLADVAHEPFAGAEIRRLQDLRLQAAELAIESDLVARRHGEVLGELRSLIADEPLRERLRAQQMLALYRSGRQRRSDRVLGLDVPERDGPVLSCAGQLERAQRTGLVHDRPGRLDERPARRGRALLGDPPAARRLAAGLAHARVKAEVADQRSRRAEPADVADRRQKRAAQITLTPGTVISLRASPDPSASRAISRSTAAIS